MITINEDTLKELVLRSEPDFLTQAELQLNGYGVVRNFSEDGDPVWVWTKAKVRSCTGAELNYLVLKIVE
jgi:hypothetical protein